jgi:hypothetical protein
MVEDPKKKVSKKTAVTKPSKKEIIPMPRIMPEIARAMDDLDKFIMLLAYKLHGEIVKTERVDTGLLRASYVVNREGYCEYVVGTDVEYGPNVEARFGTVKNADSKLPQMAQELLAKTKPGIIEGAQITGVRPEG